MVAGAASGERLWSPEYLVASRTPKRVGEACRTHAHGRLVCLLGEVKSAVRLADHHLGRVLIGDGGGARPLERRPRRGEP